MFKKLFNKKKKKDLISQEQEKESYQKLLEGCLKIVMIGDRHTGKSSILNQFCRDTFYEHYLSTIGLDFAFKSIVLGNKDEIKLQIWDYPQHEDKYTKLPTLFDRHIHVILFVFDLTDAKSFQHVKNKILVTAEGKVMNQACVAVLVGNKLDKSKQRVITLKQGCQLADTIGGSYMQVSAKTNKYIHELFFVAAQKRVNLSKNPPYGKSFNQSINSYLLQNKDNHLGIFHKQQQQTRQVAPGTECGLESQKQKMRIINKSENAYPSQNIQAKDNVVKILLFGNENVGKSTMVAQYIHEQFKEQHNETFCLDYKEKQVLNQGISYTLKIFDISGSKMFQGLTKPYYHQISQTTIIAVYNVCNFESFKICQQGIKDIKKINNSVLYYLLLGNKVDLESQRQVSTEMGMQLAQNLKTDFMEISSKNYEQVKLVFQKCIENSKTAKQVIQ